MTPRVERPNMADYGVPAQLDGTLPWSWARERLERCRNYWVVTASADGRPAAMPVWGVWRSDPDEFCFSCAATARKAANLAVNPWVVVAPEDTVEVVSIEGRASRIAHPGTLGSVIEAYVAKYAEPGGESELTDFLGPPNLFFRVEPVRGYGIIERAAEFGPRATRWRW